MEKPHRKSIAKKSYYTNKFHLIIDYVLIILMNIDNKYKIKSKSIFVLMEEKNQPSLISLSYFLFYSKTNQENTEEEGLCIF